jgi:LacI family transcriptional regulator
MFETTGQYEGGYAGAHHLFSSTHPPTAIFGFNDTMAIGALRYALEHGIDVPGDLSIIGVDNIPISSFVSPCLTTVAQPLGDLGRTAAELLLERVKESSGESNDDIQHRMLPTRLIVRESTGPAKP